MHQLWNGTAQNCKDWFWWQNTPDSERPKVHKKSKPTRKLKHANSVLEYFEYFCQMSSKSIFTILSYTASKLVHFFWDTVYIASAIFTMMCVMVCQAFCYWRNASCWMMEIQRREQWNELAQTDLQLALTSVVGLNWPGWWPCTWYRLAELNLIQQWIF